MSFDQNIHDVFLSLNSSKKKDRLNALDVVSIIVKQERTIAALSEDPTNDTGGVNWDNLYLRVHNAVLNDASKVKQLPPKVFDTAREAIISVVKYSNGYIHTKSLVSSILSVFESPEAMASVGSIYFDLVKDHLLNDFKYRSHLRSNDWNDLVTLCRQNMEHQTNAGLNTKYLNLLYKLISVGRHYSLKPSYLKTLLPFLKKTLYDRTPANTFDWYLLQLLNELLQVLAIEARYVLAEFTESTVEAVMSMYEMGKEKNDLIFKYLDQVINIHHPGGVGLDSTLAHAADWSRWLKLIKEIHHVCELEVREILRTGPKYEMYSHFMNLLVDVTILMSSMPETCESSSNECSTPAPISGSKRKSCDSSWTQTQKRARMEGGLVNTLRNMKPVDSWFWLKLLSGVLERHPSSFMKDHSELCNIVCNLLCQPRERLTSEPLSVCTQLLLQRESQRTDDSSQTIIGSKESLWAKVAEIIVRSITKENTPEQHAILQSLIRHSKWKDFLSLIELYVNQQIPITSSSLNTLMIILKTGLKLDNEKKNLILQCCFKDCTHLQIASVIVILLIGKDDETPYRTTPKQRDSLFSTCEKLALQGVTSSHKTEGTKNAVTLPFSPNYSVVNALKDIVNNHCRKLVNDLKHIPTSRVLQEAINMVEFILLLLSSFRGIVEFPTAQFTSMLSELYRNVVEVGIDFLNPPTLRLDLFSQVYAANVHPDIHQLIRQTPDDLLVLKDVFCFWQDHGLQWPINIESTGLACWKSGDASMSYCSAFTSLLDDISTDSANPLRREVLCAESNCYGFLIDATEALCQFVNCPGSINEFQETLAVKIVDSLLDAQHLNLKSGPHLQMVLRTILLLGTCPSITVDVLNTCLDLTKLVYKCDALHPEVLPMVIAILSKLVPTVRNQGDDSTFERFADIVSDINKLVRKKTSPSSTIAFLKLLSIVAEADLSGYWANCKQSRRMIAEEMLTFLDHESIEVRLFAAEEVGKLFIPCREIENIQTSRLQKLKDLIMIQRPEADVYEKMAEVATALISLAQVFRVSSSFRIRVASMCLQIMVLFELTKDEIKCFLKLLSLDSKTSISKYFVRHLKQLLSQWVADKFEASIFPYCALECDTRVDFYSKYLPEITTSCALSGDTSTIKQVSSLLNIPVEEIAMTCYPMLAAEIRLKNSSNIKDFINKQIPYDRQEILLCEQIALCLHSALRDVKNSSSLRDILSLFQKDILVQLANKQPSSIQSLLLHLEGDIVNSTTSEDFKASFKTYVWFVGCYMETVKGSGLNVGLNTYVLRDVFSVVLRTLRASDSIVVVEIGCDCIRDALEHCPDDLKTEVMALLPGLVSALTPLAAHGKVASKSALALLRFILIERCSQYDTMTLRLDPFPDEEQFSSFDFHRNDSALIDELKQFSEVVGHGGRRIGGLTRLLRLLSTKKDDLRDIYKQIGALRGFSEECAESVLHKVIYQLVKLCSHNDCNIRIEAAKCLGELGAADLTTLVLKPADTAIADHCTVELRLLDKVKIELGQLMQQESFAVKRAASEALYAVMSCDGANLESSMYYVPFHNNASKNLVLAVNTADASHLQIWIPKTLNNHEEWVVELTSTLFESLSDSLNLCDRLADVCRVHAPFAESMLPLLLHCILTKGTQELVQGVSRNVNEFFKNYIANKDSINIKSVRCMVEIVDYIRTWEFRSGYFKSDLNIDFLLVAEAASNCSVYFTALMYAELWFEQEKAKEMSLNKKLMNIGVDELRDRGDTLSNVLRHCYSSIGIKDGLYGCGKLHLTHSVQRAAHLEQLGRFDMSLLSYDFAGNISGEIRALRNLGLYNVLSRIAVDAETQMECAARLGDWNFTPPSDAVPSFQYHQYNALKAYSNSDLGSFSKEIINGTTFVIDKINNSTREGSQNLYQALSQLQSLKQLMDFSEAKQKNTILQLQRKWEQQDKLKPCDFTLLEPVLAARCAIVKIESDANNSQNKDMSSLLGQLLLRTSKMARRYGQWDVALQNITKLNNMNGISEKVQLEGKMEESRIFWAKGESNIALVMLESAMNNAIGSSTSDLKAICLRRYGGWLVERKAENPRKIINDFFVPASVLSSKPEENLKCYNSIARFADSNYAQLQEYLISPCVQMKQSLIEQQNYIHDGLKKECSVQSMRDKVLTMHLAKNQSAIDDGELKNIHNESSYFLKYAVRYYLMTLKTGDKFDHVVFRLVSLWMNNHDDPEILQILEDLLPTVSSHKFLCVLPQLSPRMADVPLVYQTIERMLQQHPLHTLPVLFALKNSFADLQYCPGKQANPTPRVKAATQMLQGAVKTKLRRAVDQMNKYTDALIQFANYACDKNTRSFTIPPALRITSLKDLESVPDPAYNLPIRQDLRYERIPGIWKFEPTFEFVGGLNCPKKVVSIDTNGHRRTLLVKGRDDLRQDAVMQQVFGVMNELLQRDAETSRHKLVIRTYRVQPLSQRSGVIEWCENTQPIAMYLVGRNNCGAHVRFNPYDMKPPDCRKMLESVKEANSETKLRIYLDICSKLRPAFQYFFLEKFPTAGVWFERRLAFIRSVATSSMIGYILGIGDRHLMNILIDNSTAEAIHIDLGIAFEQGRTLPTPETVPFRLTRDIEAGMGCAGLDGPFRLCSERTMKMLRDSKDTIVTLLEVLLHDPLYAWAITPEKAMSMQSPYSDSSSNGNSSDSSPSRNQVNALAERALVRLKTKLQGMEQGGVVTTVEGQVSGLIQQARDPTNLSRLYFGWQAYL